jgi:alpha-beta hydrolase superfamily lysophospholipase
VATTPPTAPPPLEPFAGPGDFYDLPAPLLEGPPGALIRFEPVDEASSPDRVLWRVMYHTRDAQDRDAAVTGLVSVPTGPAPDGGWSTLSWGHGTSGMAPTCAPSRGAKGLPAFGTSGIVAGADYLGLGPNGQRHAYLSGISEGHSVIDAVRAARQIPGVSASDEWTTVGISQGGHAVLWASELAGSYAPELDLVGTVAMAPGTELDRSFPGDQPQVVAVIKTMAVYGLAVDHPELDPDEYASPALQAASAQLDQECLAAVSAALVAIPPDGLWTVDPLTTDVGRRIASENNPGSTTTSAPLLIVQGDADIVVVPARTQAFFERVCGIGQNATLVTVPGADHDLKSEDARAQIGTWLQDRLSHRATTSGC